MAAPLKGIMQSLSAYMHRTIRQLVIQHKDIFKAAIIAYAKAMPDPDSYEPDYINDYLLKRMQAKFMGYLRLEDMHKGQVAMEKSLYAAFWKIVRVEMGHDRDHCALLEFIGEEYVEAVMDGEWKPRAIGMPGPRVWGEPRTEHEGNYGGFHGRRFRNLIKKEG